MSNELAEEAFVELWTDKEAFALLRQQGYDADNKKGKGAIATQVDNRNVTPLHATARAGGPIDQVKWLIDHGADVRAVDILQNTCLHAACAGGNYETAEHIIKMGGSADLNRLNLQGMKPHALAQRCGSLTIMNLCFDSGAENLGLRGFAEKWVANRPPIVFFDD